jgi:Rab-GTPase-TBC domain
MQGQTDLPEEVAFDIEKDVNRTFPEVARCASACAHVFAQLCTPSLALVLLLHPSTWPLCCRFATGKGVQSLMNVLKAYAALDPEVGYCQGAQHMWDPCGSCPGTAARTAKMPARRCRLDELACS